jgi:hypothetical protein
MKIIKNKNLFWRRTIAGVIFLSSLFFSFLILNNNKVLGSLPVWCQGDELTCEYCYAPDTPTVTTVDNSETVMVGAVHSGNNSGCSSYFKLYRDGVLIQTMTGLNCQTTYTDDDYTDTGRNPGTTYTYTAVACQDGCESCAYNEGGAYCVPQSDECSSTSSGASHATAFYAPTSLNAVCHFTDVDLTWVDNSSAESGYKVEKDGSVLATTAANAESYGSSSGSLVENHSYTFRVRAYHTSGKYSSYSNEDSCTTNIVPPDGLGTTVISSTAINLVWNDNSSVEDGYKIERATGACTGFAQIGTAVANAESYSDSGLLHGTTYCYRVRAYDGGVNSNYSSTDSDTTIMPAPTNLSGVAASQTQVNLVWTDNSNSETGFKIERANNSDCSGTPSFSQITTVGSGVTSYSNTGLTSNTSYCYRVRSYTAYADSAYSSTVTVSTSLPSPTNLTAVVSATSTTQINLTWTDNSDNENEFRLERKTGSSGTYTQIVSVATNTTAYANTGVSDGTIYYYRARACNAVACSSYSNEASVTTVLVAPTNLTCTSISSSQINLTWTDNSTSETGFKIERDISSPPSTVIFTTGQNAITYNDANLSENTLYYYRVRAYNSASGVYSGYTSICSTSTPIYVPTGNMTSSTFDTGKVGGVAFNNILWKGTQPSDSHVLFHFASSNSSTSTFNFIGPDGTSATYYQSSGSNTIMNISTRYHNNHRYFRYKAYIYPNSSNASPQITDIVIGYSP